MYCKTEQNKALYIFLTDYIQSHFLLTLESLDIIQIFFYSRKIRILVFYMREHIELVYILQNKVEKAIVYFFGQIIFRAILLLTLGCLDKIQIFFNSRKYTISIFYMREHMELVNTPKKSRIAHSLFFLTDYIQSNIFFNIGVPR